jgi:predicted PurR-regulated permease PerM
MPHQGLSWVEGLVALAGVILLGILLVLTVQVLLVPLVAAMFLAYLFEPVIARLQRRGTERGRAYILVFAAATIGLVVLLSLAPSWLDVTAQPETGSTQTLSERLGALGKTIEDRANHYVPAFRSMNISEKLAASAAELAERLLVQLPSLVTSFTLNLILVPIIAYFMIRDGRKLRRRIVALVPNRYFEMSMLMFYRIDDQIGGYLRGRLIECMLVTVTQILLMGIASYYADQPQILLISIVCGVTNLIPYAGPVMGGAFGVFYYFAIGLELKSIFVPLAVIAIAHLIDNILIAPAVLSHNVNLHPLTVALVLIIGGEVLGVLGLLIAIPVASSIKVVVQEFYANYQAQVR